MIQLRIIPFYPVKLMFLSQSKVVTGFDVDANYQGAFIHNGLTNNQGFVVMYLPQSLISPTY